MSGSPEECICLEVPGREESIRQKIHECSPHAGEFRCRYIKLFSRTQYRLVADTEETWKTGLHSGNSESFGAVILDAKAVTGALHLFPLPPPFTAILERRCRLLRSFLLIIPPRILHLDLSHSAYSGYSSGMFSGAQNLTVTGHNLTNTTNYYTTAATVSSDVRMVPLSDIDLQQEICLENSMGLVNRHRIQPSVRRIYSAKIRGQTTTVAMYQGRGAEEPSKYSSDSWSGKFR
ncbi:hypothetical protein B0H19DRAFT_1066697 [Mycena capillaripes]|nr:hypothetical protein B0H19DRAFT_1066697 [Mycena capillaripes]